MGVRESFASKNQIIAVGRRNIISALEADPFFKEFAGFADRGRTPMEGLEIAYLYHIKADWEKLHDEMMEKKK